MREWLTVVHRVGMAIEKVVRSSHYFPTDDRVEMTEFNGHVAVRCFGIKLWNCVAVDAIVPTVVPVIIVDTKRLGILCIDPVDIVDSSTQAETVGSVRSFFCIQPSLVNIDAIWMSIKEWQRFVVVTDLKPSASCDTASSRAKEREGIAQIATSATKWATTATRGITSIANVTRGTDGTADVTPAIGCGGASARF